MNHKIISGTIISIFYPHSKIHLSTIQETRATTPARRKKHKNSLLFLACVV